MYDTVYVLSKPPVATFIKSSLDPRMLNKQLIKEFCAVEEDPTLVASSPELRLLVNGGKCPFPE